MKAKLFIWPKLTPDQFERIEGQAIKAGYAKKVWVSVGRVKCWLAT